MHLRSLNRGFYLFLKVQLAFLSTNPKIIQQLVLRHFSRGDGIVHETLL